MSDVEHPHGALEKWLDCCIEKRLRQSAGEFRIPDAVVKRMASSLRDVYAFPRESPLEIWHEPPLHPKAEVQAPIVRRQRIRILGTERACATCGKFKKCPYLVPSGRKFDPAARRECSVCYHARHPSRYDSR